MKTPHNEGRTVDTAWLLAAISAIDQEFEEGRLKFDENFLAFAGILDGLHQQAQDFIPSPCAPGRRLRGVNDDR